MINHGTLPDCPRVHFLLAPGDAIFIWVPRLAMAPMSAGFWEMFRSCWGNWCIEGEALEAWVDHCPKDVCFNNRLSCFCQKWTAAAKSKLCDLQTNQTTDCGLSECLCTATSQTWRNVTKCDEVRRPIHQFICKVYTQFTPPMAIAPRTHSTDFCIITRRNIPLGK